MIGRAEVTSEEPALASTIYALSNRELVKTPRTAGVWTAVITDIGRYYLEHGRNPREAMSNRHEAARPKEVRARPLRFAISPDELIERLVAAGGRLRIPDPDPETRAAWRRAIHAARKSPSLPEGRMLWHKGRDAGDILIELRDRPEPRSSEPRERVRIPVPERLGRTHPVVGELKGATRSVKASGFGRQSYPIQRNIRPLDVPRTSVARALRIMQALVTEAERRGHQVRIEEGARRPWRDVCIVVKGHAHPITVRERDGHLQVILPSAYEGRRLWTDGARRSIEDKLGDVLANVESRADEAELRRLERDRHEQERSRRWEEARAEARDRFIQDHRAEILRRQVESWRLAKEIRAFCSEMRGALVAAELTSDTGAWLQWAVSYAEAIDPVLHPPGMPTEPEPADEALRPYLLDWNPWGLGV